MQRICYIALFLVLGLSSTGGQQATPSAPPQKEDAQPERVKVYAVGPEVTAPELLPLNQPPFPNEKCKHKLDGEESVSILVDATGRPRNLVLLLPLASGLDDLALQIVAADRFRPGTHEGLPVVIALTAKLSLKTCVEEKKDGAGETNYSLLLRSQPKQIFETLPHPPKEAVLTLEDSSGSCSLHVYHVGGGVSSPVVLNSVSPEFTDEARRAKFDGKCLLSLLVDEQGMPQKIWVVRPLGMGLDEKAIEAVRQYRFKPAMKDGMPVSVMISIQVNFMLVN